MFRLLVLISLLLDFCVQNNVLTVNNLLFQKSGNVSITGIFNNRFGDECENEADKSLEEIASAIWIVEALNKYQYLPGITLGLSIFGFCQNSKDQKDFIKMTDFFNNDNIIGTITTPEVHKIFSDSESFLSQNIVHLEHIITIDMMIHAIVQLLINLQWTSVSIVASDSTSALKLFKEKASEEAILVNDELLMNSRNSGLKLSNSEKSPIVVVIAGFDNISKLIEKVDVENIKLILTPIKFIFDIRSLDLPKNTIVLLPAMANNSALSSYIKNKVSNKGVFNYKPPTEGPLFIGMAASILKFLKPLKKMLEQKCPNPDFHSRQPCPSTTDLLIEILSNKTNLVLQKSMKISTDDVKETLKVLKIEQNSNSETFLYIASVINGNASDDLAIFQIFSLKTKKFQPVLRMINDNVLKDPEMITDMALKSDYFNQAVKETEEFSRTKNPVFNLLQKFVGHSGENERIENISFSKTPFKKDCDSEDVQNSMCPHPVINHTAETQANDTKENIVVAWRFLTWVSINTSLGFVGVTCTLSAIFFIIIRLCKDDLLEGSPYFMLLLMISVIFTYISSIPFHMKIITNNEFICDYRQNGPSVVFAVLFSLLLSRSLVLAFSEDGKELNGYLQSILCFFMIGVQISIVLQKWIFKKDNYDLNCLDISDKYKILFSLGYDFLLLFLLACVSPFIVRLKRNYKEGLLFSIGVFFVIVVWSAWLSFYVLLPNEHKDAAVAVGLNSTASVLLFCIFIPQIYFMAAPFRQDANLRSFSTLDRHILKDVSNVDFRSNELLGTITYKASEMGLSNPNFLTTSSNEGCERETIIDASSESPN